MESHHAGSAVRLAAGPTQPAEDRSIAHGNILIIPLISIFICVLYESPAGKNGRSKNALKIAFRPKI